MHTFRPHPDVTVFNDHMAVPGLGFLPVNAFLLHAATIDGAALGARRNLSMPGLSATVAEQIAALAKVAGPKVAGRIRHAPDPAIVAIVSGWPRNFDTQRARALGFKAAEATFEDIVRIHIEDELGGRFVA